jgi:hypothetical protein
MQTQFKEGKGSPSILKSFPSARQMKEAAAWDSELLLKIMAGIHKSFMTALSTVIALDVALSPNLTVIVEAVYLYG